MRPHKFTNATPNVQVIELGNGLTAWKLGEDYYYHWQHGGNWHRIKIDAGFVFDGASVPWFMRWIAGRGRFGLRAPLIHDWLHDYQGWVDVEIFEGGTWVPLGFKVRWTRRQADSLFFRELRLSGVEPRWLRRGAYKAVRAWSLVEGDKWR